MSLALATRSETTKQFTTAAWWVLALVLALYIATTAGALAFVFSASATGALAGEVPPLPDETLPAMLYSTATSVGYVFPLLIGTLMVTGEFRHQTLTPTFLATPRRGRVLTAKLLVGIVMGVLYGVVAILAAVGPSAGILAAFGIDTALDDPDTWTLAGRMLLASVLWVLVGIGVGSLVRSQVGAVVGVLVFTQFLEPIARAAAAFVDGLSTVTQYLPGAAGDALVGASVFETMPGVQIAALEWWAGGAVLLGYALLFVVLGGLITWRRDVS